MPASEPRPDPRKVRAGLVVVVLVVAVSLVLLVVIDDPLGRVVMFGIALTAFVRAFLLTRALRREQS